MFWLYLFFCVFVCILFPSYREKDQPYLSDTGSFLIEPGLHTIAAHVKLHENRIKRNMESAHLCYPYTNLSDLQKALSSSETHKPTRFIDITLIAQIDRIAEIPCDNVLQAIPSRNHIPNVVLII